MSTRAYVDQELEGLDDAELRLVAEYVAFLKVRSYLHIGAEETDSALAEKEPDEEAPDEPENGVDVHGYAWL